MMATDGTADTGDAEEEEDVDEEEEEDGSSVDVEDVLGVEADCDDDACA